MWSKYLTFSLLFQDNKHKSDQRDYVNNRRLFKNKPVDYWKQPKDDNNTQRLTFDHSGEKKRDLIKEYFARTRAQHSPPPIFQSNNSQFPAYFAASHTDTYLDPMPNLVDENFKEIDVSSVIVPETKSKDENPPKSNTYFATPAKVRRNSDGCHLIGKVNPNILRTWEQLNLGQQQHNDPAMEQGNEPYFHAQEELASFKVNYVTYDRIKAKKSASSDDLFYDSIDEEERSEISCFDTGKSSATGADSIIYCGDYNQNEIDVDHQAPSLMTDIAEQYMMEAPLTAGEGMAEWLDKKRLKCWSLEGEIEEGI